MNIHSVTNLLSHPVHLDIIVLTFPNCFQIAIPVLLSLVSLSQASSYCSGYDKVQKNSIYGDALNDSPDCLARDGKAYPR